MNFRHLLYFDESAQQLLAVSIIRATEVENVICNVKINLTTHVCMLRPIAS